MESLESLAKFVKKYSQREGKSLNYSFLGGTAIRLYQEKFGDSPDRRIISDFDLLSFNNKSYPVHTINPSLIFGLTRVLPKELERYVENLRIKNQNYEFMDGSFLAFSKSCAIDNPREKDYFDVKYLYENGHIDFGKLNHLFDSSDMVNNSKERAVKGFKWFFDEPSKSKSILFQSFPRFVNLVSEFEDFGKAEAVLVNYSKRDLEKTGYAVSSTIYDMHSVIKELSSLKDKEKLRVLKELSSFARANNYIDFSRKVHRELVPKARNSKDKERAVLDSLI